MICLQCEAPLKAGGPGIITCYSPLSVPANTKGFKRAPGVAGFVSQNF